MRTNYDHIAKQYKESKTLPFRRYIELYTYQQMLGDLDGKNVLDLGCGEGFYTRRVKRWGARDVVGVDISPPHDRFGAKSRIETTLGDRIYC